MLKYKIALVNVFWSEDENNTRYFINRNEQNLYFDNLANGKISPFVNFNMGNYIDTNITYHDESNRSVDEILKCNYAIVYKYEDDLIVDRRYYFAYPSQDSGRQMRVILRLDDVQTNFLSKQGLFDQQVMITRAHLNRYLKTTDNQFVFNLGTPNSPFYQLEDFKTCPKRLIKRTSLNIHVDTKETSNLNDWIDENIIGWEYVYLSPSYLGTSQAPTLYEYSVLDPHDFSTVRHIKLPGIHSASYETEKVVQPLLDIETNGKYFKGAVACVCAPVYKYNGSGDTFTMSFAGGGHRVSISTYGLEKFLERNDYASRVVARKFSIRPPFLTYEWPTSSYTLYPAYQSIDIIASITDHSFEMSNISCVCGGTLTVGSHEYGQGCLIVNVDVDAIQPYETQDYTIDKPVVFSASEIVESSRDNFNLNPKLLSNQFFEVNITNFSQNFTYDFQKMNNKTFKILYNEALTPDLTKGYARIKGANGLYIEDCDRNLTGLIISNDYSLMVANDKLSEMLANNKNFFLQQAFNIGGSLINGFGKEGGLLQAVFNTGSSIANTFMNLDNMRSSPVLVKNSNGNVYFASDIQPFKLAIEEYDILDYDKKAFNDYCYMFGYKYNRMGLLSDFVNIRAQFNYIEADLINISVPMQNEEKRRLIEKFRLGIRFWNTDLPDFSRQNYENEVFSVYQGE